MGPQPDQFASHRPDVRIGVVPEQPQPVREHFGGDRAAGGGLASVASEGVECGGANAWIDVGKHAGDDPERFRVSDMVEQPAALTPHRRVVVVETAAYRRERGLRVERSCR